MSGKPTTQCIFPCFYCPDVIFETWTVGTYRSELPHIRAFRSVAVKIWYRAVNLFHRSGTISTRTITNTEALPCQDGNCIVLGKLLSSSLEPCLSVISLRRRPIICRVSSSVAARKDLGGSLTSSAHCYLYADGFHNSSPVSLMQISTVDDFLGWELEDDDVSAHTNISHESKLAKRTKEGV